MQYERIFTKDVYAKLRLRDFQNHPIIAYVKQYNDLVNFDSFIHTLWRAFRVQKGLSAKVLMLLDSSTSTKARILPDYYKVLRNRYQMDQVIENDFICKCGDYLGILERLLTNRYGLDVLIIVDAKAFNDVVLQGSFYQCNVCFSGEQAVKLGLPLDTVVVNENSDISVMTWPMKSSVGDNKQDEFLSLSSQEAVQKILQMSVKMANAL